MAWCFAGTNVEEGLEGVSWLFGLGWLLGVQLLANLIKIGLVRRGVHDFLILILGDIFQLDGSEASESLLLTFIDIHILKIWCANPGIFDFSFKSNFLFDFLLIHGLLFLLLLERHVDAVYHDLGVWSPLHMWHLKLRFLTFCLGFHCFILEVY